MVGLYLKQDARLSRSREIVGLDLKQDARLSVEK